MKSVFAAFFLLALFPAQASEDSQVYVKQLESAYKRARTLEAKFLQEYSEGGRVTAVRQAPRISAVRAKCAGVRCTGE